MHRTRSTSLLAILGLGFAISSGSCARTEEGECKVDADCAAKVPPTVPPDCAVGVCKKGVCAFVAKDEDGDGSSTAECTSASRVPVTAGGDCDDRDPELYPGHPRSCEGFAPCAGGQVSCLPDGHRSPCIQCLPGQTWCCGSLPVVCDDADNWTPAGDPCSSGVCSNGACVGTCVSGTRQCVRQQPQECDGTNEWQDDGSPCNSQACVGGDCVGQCAPGSTVCATNATSVGILTCDASGTWGKLQSCMDQACVGQECWGECAPGVDRCADGASIETCGANGSWTEDSPRPCATGTCADGGCTGATTLAPSCNGAGDGLGNCGASAESCCTSLEVPGGSYDRIYDAPPVTPPRLLPSLVGGPDPATVSGFRLDKYLVTVGRFRAFAAAVAGGWTPASGSGRHAHVHGGAGLTALASDVSGAIVEPPSYESGWNTADDSQLSPTTAKLACDPTYATWTDAPAANETLPANCANWYEAEAFCIWDRGFLPSAAEAEYTAAGGGQQRAFPWGATTPGSSNEYAIYDCLYPNGSTACSDLTNIAPVGSAPLGAGLWGQLDLAGEVYEWALDDARDAGATPCDDCVTVDGTGQRLTTGGCFSNTSAYLAPPNYAPADATTRAFFIGFRCARIP